MGIKKAKESYQMLRDILTDTGSFFPSKKNLILPRLTSYDGIEELLKFCERERLTKRPWMITGKTTYKIAGKAIESLFSEKGYTLNKKICNSSNLSFEIAKDVTAGVDKPSVIIAVGGGSKLDLGKLVAEEKKVGYICVPTAASHDGIASNSVSVYKNGTIESKTVGVPLAIIFDLNIISQAPPRLNASGWGDVFSNYTASEDWKLAYKQQGKEETDFSRSIYLVSSRATKELIKGIGAGHRKIDYESGSLKFLLGCLWASAIFMNLTGTSAPCSGAEHKFDRIITQDYNIDATHGELCGIGAIYTAYLHKLKWKDLRTALKKVGAPVDLTGRLKKEDVIDAFYKAIPYRPKRYTILNKKFDDKSESQARSRIKKGLKHVQII